MEAVKSLNGAPFLTLVNILKGALPMDMVVDRYIGILEKGSDGYLTGACPLKIGDSDKACRGDFKIKPTRDLFYCFKCNKGGDNIAFIKEAEGYSYPEAVYHLAYEFIADNLTDPRIIDHLKGDSFKKS